MGIVVRGDNSKGRLRLAKRLTCLALAVFICITTAVTPYAQALPEETSAPAVTVVSTELPESYDIMQTVPSVTEAPTSSVPDVTDSPAVTSAPETSVDTPDVTDTPTDTDQPSSDVTGTPSVTDIPDTGIDIIDTGDVTDSSDVTDVTDLSDTSDVTDESGDETSDISDILDGLDPNDSFVDADGVMFFTLTRGAAGSVTWKVGVNSSGYYTLLVEGDGEVPSNILESEDVAPYINQITRVQINNGVTSIGENAFRELPDLTEVRFEDNSTLTNISSGAFADCPMLRIINLEDCHALTSIGNTDPVHTSSSSDSSASSLREAGAFSGSGLTSIVIPTSLKNLGHCTFYNCDKLTDVYFEGTSESEVFTFGADVFEKCTALKNINLEALKGHIITKKIDILEKYSQGLFRNCDSLESIIIPSGFGYNDSPLVAMFNDCDKLTSIVFERNENITGANNQIDNIISGSTRNIQILDLRNLVKLTEIGIYAIRGEKLSIVYLPASVEKLCNEAFSDCDSLTAVVFPEGSNLKSLDSSCFLRDDNIVSVNLENTQVETIGDYTFQHAPALTEITFPATLKKVGGGAFEDCRSLSRINYNAADLTSVADTAFNGVTSKINIHVGTSVNFINESFLKAINGHVGDFTFEPGCKFTVSANISNLAGYDTPFKAIGNYETDEHGNLYRVDGSIKILVLASKDSTETFTVPGDVTRIASYAFKGRSGITAINFEDISKIAKLDEYAFADCNNLENLTAADYATTAEVKTALETKFPDVANTLFVNTKVSGLSSDDDIGGVAQTNTYNFNELTLSAEKYYNDTADALLTGQTWIVTVGVSNQETKHRYRLYVKHEDGCKLDNLGNDGAVTGPHPTDNPNIHYYQIFDDRVAGSAGTFSLPISYANGTAPGNKVKVWAVQGDQTTFGDDFDARVIYPNGGTEGSITADNRYLEMVWTTEPLTHNVAKTHNASVTPSFAVKNGQPTLTNLHYNIDINFSGTAHTDYGTDNSIAAEYRDIITLPDELTWRDGLKEAIASGKYNFTIKRQGNSSFSTLYATVGGAEYDVFSVALNEAQGCNIAGVRLEWDADKNAPVLIWQVRSANNNQLPTLNANLNIGDVIVGGDGFDALSNEQKLQIVNEVDTRVTRQFSEDEFRNSECAVEVSKSPAKLSLGKEMLNDPKYLGEDVKYRITLENDTAIDTTAGSLAADGGALVVHDGLYPETADDRLKLQYIKPENIVKMFEGFDGDRLKIEISAAVLTKMNIPDNAKTVLTVDGEETVTLAPSNTADVTNHYAVSFKAGTPEEQQYDSRHECSDDANVITKNAVITIEKVGGQIQVTVTDGAEMSGTYTVTDGQSLKALFDSIGYIVTPDTKYDLFWTYPADHIFKAGEPKTIEYTATIKNSFMAAPKDKHYFYNYESTENNATAFNFVEIQNPSSDYTKSYAEVSKPKIEKDLQVNKYYYVNGENKTNSHEFRITNGDVLDYGLGISHYGTSSYDVLPCVDSMVGPQVLLAEVNEKNNHLSGLGLPIYTYTNKKGEQADYYVLKKKGETYHNVWLGGYCAESVTVTDPDPGEELGCKTIIKWYFKDTIPRDFDMDIFYKALVSIEYSGAPKESDDTVYKTYKLDNTFWLNDHPEHRIYDYIGMPVSVVDFRKIAIERAGVTLGEDEQKSCPVGVGNTIKYQFEFTIKGNASDILTNADIYDILPYTAEPFEWSKANVSISYGSNDKKHPDTGADLISITYNDQDLINTVPTGEEWEIIPAVVDGQEKGNYQIKWKDGFKISLGNPGDDFNIKNERKAYIYVTLTFPSDTDVWDKYVSDSTGKSLVNTLVCNDQKSNVTHTLSSSCRAFIQKGVYETGSLAQDTYWGPRNYFRGEDRFHYATTSSGSEKPVVNLVTYYVVIANTGKTKLYLPPIYDILPEGFDYFSLCANTSEPYHVGEPSPWDRDLVECQSGGAPEDYKRLVLGFSNDKIKFQTAKVKMTDSTKKIGNRQVIKLEVMEGDQSWDFGKAGNKDDHGLYLEPNQAIQFGITCKTSSTAVKDAENIIAMEYLNYTDSLLTLDAESAVPDPTGITVSDVNGLTPNDGERFIVDDTDPLVSKLDHVMTSGKTQWLTSSVTVQPGEIKPGIEKSAEKPLYKIENRNIQDENGVVWTVTSHNAGNEGISNYKIVDTLDYPLRFEGDFRYRVEFDDESIYGGNYGELDNKKWVLIANEYGNTNNFEPKDWSSEHWVNLFSIDRLDNGSIRVWSNMLNNGNKNEHIDLQPNGSGGNLWVRLLHRGNGHLGKQIHIEFKTTDVTGSDGKTYKQETLIVTFADDAFAIVPHGKSIFDVSSKMNPDAPSQDKIGTFNNTAYLVPTQNYNNTAGFGEDTVYNSSRAVLNSAQITTYADSPTSSVKKIEEVDDLTNFGLSTTPLKNKIIVDNAAKKVKYTLSVSNGAEATIMKQLVIIDNLPEAGDTMTFSGHTPRNSEFMVSLDDNPGFVVTVTSTNPDGTHGTPIPLTLGSDYTIEYRSDSNFDKTQIDESPDWKGEANGEWTANAANARSFRVVIKKEIKAGDTVDISFNAKLDPKAKPGQIAWNSFAYCFKTQLAGNATDSWLYAAPKQVGVGLPELPDIQKRRVIKQNDELVDYKADQAETFTFIICSTDSLPDITDYTAAGIKSALDNAGVSNAEFTLNVPARSAYSDKLSLENIETIPADWVWELDKTYTVIEVPNDNYIAQPVITTFTYLKDAHPDVVVQNVHTKSIEITKVDRTDNTKLLKDAVFGLYSPVSGDQMTDEQIGDYLTANSLTLNLDSAKTIKKNGKTYYLYRLAKTGENGKITFDKLSQEDYLIKELKAPDGYYVIPAQSEQVCDLKTLPNGTSTKAITIQNRKKALFPHTGGRGCGSAVLPGALLALFGACAYAVILRRRIRGRNV